MTLQGTRLLNFFPYFDISAGVGQKVLTVIRKSVGLVIDPTHNIKLSISSCNIKLTFWEAKVATVYWTVDVGCYISSTAFFKRQCQEYP